VEADPKDTELYLGGLGRNAKIFWERVPRVPGLYCQGDIAGERKSLSGENVAKDVEKMNYPMEWSKSKVAK
jgi:hypothetical protein